MVATTWLDRITDEENVWLSAVRAEDANALEEAATLYLEDSFANLCKGSQVRGALSCSCAADCLARAGGGEISKRLYFEAGVMYAEIVEDRIAMSVREALWATERAYTCFVLARDAAEAEAARLSFVRLAKRANPFTKGGDGFDLPDPRWFPTYKDGPFGYRPGGSLKVAIDRFLSLRRKAGPGTGGMMRARIEKGVDIPDEESIASQLG